MTSRARVFVVIGLVAMLPLGFLHFGKTGDDFGFHLTSWIELLNVWRSGVLIPSWAAQTHFNLGEPRFLFYPPLSFMLGALLTAILPISVVPDAFIWISLVLAGLAMFKLSEMFLDRSRSLVAACLYICSYYVVLDVLTRFAAAELLTAALVPLIVLFYLRLMVRQGVKDGALLSLCFAGAWLMDVPEAVAIAYTLLACSLIDFAMRRQMRALIAFALAEITGICLSAVYVLPVIVYKHNIATEGLMINRWQEHLLFRVPPFYYPTALRSPLWVWTILCGAFIIVVAWSMARKQSGNARLYLQMMACIGFFALFVHTRLSAPMWTYLPELRYVQFPFRFDIFLSCILPIVFLLRFRSKVAVSLLFAACAVFAVVPIAMRFVQRKQPDKIFTARAVKAAVARGYGGILEYRPVGARSDDEMSPNLPLVAAMSGGQGCRVTIKGWAPEQRSFHSSSESGCVYRLGLIYYPDWKESLDEQETDLLRRSDDGVVVITVPAGEHEVTVHFRRPWVVEAVSFGISLMTLLFVLICLYRSRLGTSRDEKPAGLPALQGA